MPNEKSNSLKPLSVDNLRHSEYYGMQTVFDELYAKSKNGEKFTDLMPSILSRENILLAYRNIKANTGSKTAGTDKLTMADIGRLPPETVVDKVSYILAGSSHGYRPKAVRRKDIPKPNGSTRPLGIPCIWDRLIQQCIKQVIEPICEAKFSNNSHGFRPQRSVEHAIARSYQLLNLSHLHYVIEFDIKGFFDNVNHSKLIKQIWALGIQDKHLLFVLKRILTAPIEIPDGTRITPGKGTPQGGIISPLLANIMLNELDHWIDSQWQEHPIAQRMCKPLKNGVPCKSTGYRSMRDRTALKEMFIVRYADDFRIFCRTKAEAERTKIAVTKFLSERLKLEVSEEKTKIVNVKRKYSEFLGFKIKLHRKGKKDVVMSHMCDKAQKRTKEKLVNQAKNIAKPRADKTEYDEVKLFNEMVMGIQNYYRIATNSNLDFMKLQRASMTIFTNRLKVQRGNRLVKSGRKLTDFEQERYGKSKMLRFTAGSKEPIYPVGYGKHKNPMLKKRSICQYTADGRKELHDNLRLNISLMLKLMRQPLYGRSAEYADNRISLYCAQWGKCAVLGKEFLLLEDIHCHHKIPIQSGGDDKYGNLVLVLKPIHILIHATQAETIDKYCKSLGLDKKQVKKLNELREQAGLLPITLPKKS